VALWVVLAVAGQAAQADQMAAQAVPIQVVAVAADSILVRMRQDQAAPESLLLDIKTFKNYAAV
jgi:hypothetical protein